MFKTIQFYQELLRHQDHIEWMSDKLSQVPQKPTAGIIRIDNVTRQI